MAAKLAGTGSGKYDLGQNNEINVTPFVDVMLVLLIIFMVAAPLATVAVEVKLPKAYAKPISNPQKPVFISIQKTGRAFVGDSHTTLDTVCADVNKAMGIRSGDLSKERVYIRADGDVIYQDFMRILAKLQDCAYYEVALMGEDSLGNKRGLN